MTVRITLDVWVDDGSLAVYDVVDRVHEALREAAIDHEFREVENDPEGDDR